ncbi:MAG: chorismate synthase [Treponema sp.]|jgi:chorismate synthase|nr:chorismate synthase [Treponema sp.]
MAGNTFGALFRLTTFGESHGEVVGAVIDGCPAGIPLVEEDIQRELDRRRPGNHGGARTTAGTSRNEADRCEILSGVFEGKTTGTPVALLIRNTSAHSADYDNLKAVFRPGHADYTYAVKYGFRDHRGGGRSSGRETAARVAGGAVAKALLRHALGGAYSATAFTLRAAGIECRTVDFSVIEKNALRAADMEAAARMEEQLARLRAQGDSAGGIIECRVSGVPAGLGEPVFDKLDAELAKAMLSLGAVKGIEFGSGFESADKTGSSLNDAFRVDPADNRKITLTTNNCGGTLGGISTGSEIIFRLAIKPVPSIFQEQQTVRQQSGNPAAYENTALRITGRHDGCICPRIVPVVEAMSHLTLADMYLRSKTSSVPPAPPLW